MVSQTTETGHATAGRGLEFGAAGAPQVEAHASVVTPTDRVRWGPILAGLFTALSTLALLGTLGVAVGASTYDYGDRASAFGTGAGWWAALSALVAFFVGGLIAGRTAVVPGKDNGLLNGAMVWVVAIPLMIYLVGALASTAARSAHAMADTAATTSVAASNTPQGQQAANQAQATVNQAQAQGQQAIEQVRQSVTPDNVNRAAEGTARGAWWTLAAMVLGLGAASVGGLVGGRGRHHHAVTDVPAAA